MPTDRDRGEQQVDDLVLAHDHLSHFARDAVSELSQRSPPSPDVRAKRAAGRENRSFVTKRTGQRLDVFGGPAEAHRGGPQGAVSGAGIQPGACCKSISYRVL